MESTQRLNSRKCGCFPARRAFANCSSWEVNNIVLSAVAALCTFFEIARYLAESLTPWTMLFTHVVKLTCASAILALDIVVYVRNSDEHYSLAGLGIDAVLL